MYKKIGIFISSSLRNFGGGEKWLINVGNALYNKGYNVSVYGLNFLGDYDARVNNELINNKIKFVYKELPYIRNKITPLKMANIPNREFDYVYVISGYYNFLKQVIKLVGLKTYGFHNPALQTPTNFLQKKILNKIIPLFDKVHILSEFQKKFVKNKSTYLLENTWLEEIPPIIEKYEKFTILFFGRHEEIKGVNTVKYVAENIPENIEMIILGTGNSSKIFNTLSRKNVKYLGFVSEQRLYYILSKSHLVLFPSYVEASSLVALEAMAHHTPVVYRPIPQNYVLQKTKFNLPALSDKEFLDKILEMEQKYRENVDQYLKNCAGLPEYLMPKEKYIELLIKYFFS